MENLVIWAGKKSIYMKERRYCSFCGKKLVLKTLRDGSKEKYCDKCDYTFFHIPSPCVIVIVINANRILLAKGVNRKSHCWGLISGYINVGETAEECAIREVREEAGLKISHLEFIKTYAKRDRGLLMIACKAETEETSIKKSQELEDAKWFDLDDELPMQPESTSTRIVKHLFPEIKYRTVKD